MKYILLLSALVLLCWAQNTPREFKVTNAVIQNDPLVKGSLFVDILYDDLNTQNSGFNQRARREGRMRIDYFDSNDLATRKVILSEVYDFGRKFRWSFCPTSVKCEAITYKSPMPLFYYTSGTRAADGLPSNPTRVDTFLQASGNPVDCNAYQRNFGSGDAVTQAEQSSLNAVDTLWVDAGRNRVCAARLRSGKEFIFYFDNLPTWDVSTIADNAIVDDQGSTVIPIKPPYLTGNFQCPQPTCRVPLDLYFVLDESGSISNSEFSLLRQFVVDLINFFTISNKDVQVGAVMFSDGTRQVMALQEEKNTAISIVNSIRNRGGSTCVSCGVRNAHDRLGRCQTCTSASDPQDFPPDSRVRSGVGKSIVLITDGNSNVKTNLETEAFSNIAKDQITVYAIGVGNGVSYSNLQKWASTQNDVFQANDFNDLTNLLSTLLTATCEEIVVTTCGRQCTGLCICDQQCLCPPSCTSTDKCTDGSCDANVPELGCVSFNVDVQCEDAVANDPCLTAVCDPQIGCVNSTVNCDDGNPCTYDYCDSSNGCRNIDRKDPILLQPPFNQPPHNIDPSTVCFDNDICTTDECDPQTGNCNFPSIECSACLNVPGTEQVDCTLENYNPDWDKFTPCNPFVCDLTYTGPKYDVANGATTGTGPCKAQPKNFEDNNPCTINECVVIGTAPNQQAALNRTNVDCQPLTNGNLCMTAVCDPQKSVPQGTDACTITDVSDTICDDGNMCTVDVCDPGTGCTDPSLRPAVQCDSDDACKVPVCNPNTGCTTEPFACVPLEEIPAQCYEVSCNSTGSAADDVFHPYITDPNTGKAARRVESTYPCMYIQNDPDVNFDACNVCPPQNAACFLDQNSKATGIAIGAGIIAAIVIAIIVAIACAVGGGYGGYKYHQMRKADPMANATSSDIYQQPETTGTSAIHS